MSRSNRSWMVCAGRCCATIAEGARADKAYANGERDVSAALSELRVVLTRLRAGDTARPTTTDDRPIAADVHLSPQSSVRGSPSWALSDLAYQALLHAASADALLAAT